jgi:membrane protein
LIERAEKLLGAAERRIPRTVAFFFGWFKRFIEIEGIDRSIVLAAQAFTALFPLLIVYSSLAPRADGDDFADSLIERLELTGSAADSVRTAIAPPDTVASSVTAFGILFVIFSALSFTRALQRTYERSWRLEKAGLTANGWGLAWLLTMVIAYSIRPLLRVKIGLVIDAAVTLSLSAAVWCLTPYMLLARRLPWRRLIPTAAMTAVGETALGVAAAVYLPTAVSSSAQRYGAIGVAFALLGFLVASALVITVAAAGGAAFDDRDNLEHVSLRRLARLGAPDVRDEKRDDRD